RRARVPDRIQSQVMVASRRRCCLCFFLRDDYTVHKGQIAHLNHDPADSRFGNLVFLCFNHHDEFDGQTSQSKGFTSIEVRTYRDKLYAKYDVHEAELGSEKADEATEEESELIERQYAE